MTKNSFVVEAEFQSRYEAYLGHLSKIYEGVFAKIVDGYKTIIIFVKNLHHTCLISILLILGITFKFPL